MSSAFHNLVKSGFVGSLKRDVILEASSDLEYVGAIRAAFAQAGEDARRDGIACAALLIDDLIAKGLCPLATWSAGYGSDTVTVHKSRDELETIVAESPDDKHIWEYFLLSTEAGDEWVRRYEELVGERNTERR
jgi:hypothetical protein